MDSEGVQKALYDALTAALSVPVYDDVPQDEPAVYVMIGDDSQTYADTKESNGVAHRVTLDIWSSYPGYKQVKETISEIYNALHRQSISVVGQESTPLQYVLSDYWDDPSGLRHGVITFRFETTPEI